MYIVYYQYVPVDKERGPHKALSAIIWESNHSKHETCREVVGDQCWMVPGTVDPS